MPYHTYVEPFEFKPELFITTHSPALCFWRRPYTHIYISLPVNSFWKLFQVPSIIIPRPLLSFLLTGLIVSSPVEQFNEDLAESDKLAGSHQSLFNHCRCQPGDWCWPSKLERNALNSSLAGIQERLKALRPLGAVCHDHTFDAGECEKTRASFKQSVWRANQQSKWSIYNWFNAIVCMINL
jgi:hypothetical protein